MLDHFEITHYDNISGKPKKCPFFGRSVKIGEKSDPTNNFQDFLESVIKMLQKYGGEVWYFEFEYRNNGEHVMRVNELYRYLKRMVELLPKFESSTC